MKTKRRSDGATKRRREDGNRKFAKPRHTRDITQKTFFLPTDLCAYMDEMVRRSGGIVFTIHTIAALLAFNFPAPNGTTRATWMTAAFDLRNERTTIVDIQSGKYFKQLEKRS